MLQVKLQLKFLIHAMALFSTMILFIIKTIHTNQHKLPYVVHWLMILFYSTTRHVFVKHGCPRWQQSQNMANISKSYLLTSPHPQGHGMSVKCKEPLDKLIVQVWLLYLHPNFNYWTLLVSGTELRTDRQTDRRTNGRTDRRSDY